MQNRQRYTFLALALLAHAIIFYLIAHLIVFPAAPVETDNTAFTRISIPAKSPPQPAAPSDSGAPAMPMVSITPAPPVAAIVTAAPSTFTMPKINMPALVMPKLPEMPSSTTAGTGNSLGGQGDGVGANGNVSGLEGLGNALNNDGRPGEIVAVFPSDNVTYKNRQAIDEILQRDFTNIGVCLHFDHPGYPAGVYFGSNSPSVVNNPGIFATILKFRECAAYVRNCIDEIGKLSHTDTKTIVLFYSFEENYDATKFNGHCDMITHALANHKIRLCVVSFKNAPYPPLMQYIQDSGGSVSYPKGAPHQDAANQPNETATTSGDQ